MFSTYVESYSVPIAPAGELARDLDDSPLSRARMIAGSHVRTIAPPCGRAYRASMNTGHAAVWLDHKEARTFAFARK
jgi:hypothetical protein